MADEQIITNIVAKADLSSLVAEVHKATASLQNLQQELSSAGKAITTQVKVINNSFGETLRSTGQFSSHFVTLNSDVEKFGKGLDAGRLKLKDYYNAFQQQARQSGGLIRDLAKQQVMLQNAIMQPLGRNAEGLMQYNVHIPRGLDLVKNKAKLAQMELMIMNRAINEGASALINWGKNTQWAGRQLTVGLTVPIAAFGAAAAKAFREADQELVRLTKVYGDVSGSTAAELGKVRSEIAKTSKELAQSMGVNFKETISLAADIAATGKTGNELIGSLQETTRLAVLGEVDRQEAMKATLAIQSAFKQSTEELSDSINFLNAVENQTSTTLNDLVEAIPKAGPVIKGLGGSVQDLALYLTAMREGGISASEGANALKSALASLINPTDVAVAKFEGFGIDLLGIVNQNAGDVTKTLFALQGALDKLDPLQKQQAIEQLFGKFQFSRLNALFENLGKQGSQTLQVLDLMKASAGDLEALATRELTAVTESASGKYRRAIESLRAELSVVGEDFLEIGTKFINVVTKLLNMLNGLPEPVKKLITVFGGITAVAGPLIMLTGVLANFAGYILKGVTNLKMLIAGGKGWKMLTPEIVAAEHAAKTLGDTFYSDAQAAAVLEQALRNLIDEFSVLKNAVNNGNISVQPTISTMAGNVMMQGGRVVDPNNPYVGDIDTRAMSHINPRKSGFASGSLLGVVPGAQPVNRRIGATPQIYMTERLPNIEGITSVGGISTGIVADEAAKFHALMATLAMQTQDEVDTLKKTISLGGTVNSELLNTYDDLLPITQKFATKAANESAGIVAELRSAKITVDQAKARILALNAQIEAEMSAEVAQFAALRGRTIDFTKAPLMDQPVVDATGKYNLRDLYKKEANRGVLDEFGRLRGIRSYGAPYSIETTRIPKFNTGGDTSSAWVPGPNINADVVPAMLTPGEFVIRRDIAQSDPEGMQMLNSGDGMIVPAQNKNKGGMISGVQYLKTAGIVKNLVARARNLKASEVRKLIPGFKGTKKDYTVKGSAGVFIGDITDPKIINDPKYRDFVTNGVITRQNLNARMIDGDIPGPLLLAAMRASRSAVSGSTDKFLMSLLSSGIISRKEFQAVNRAVQQSYNAWLRSNKVGDSSNPYWRISDKIIRQKLRSNPEARKLWNQYSGSVAQLTGGSRGGAGGGSTTPYKINLRTSDGRIVSIDPLEGSGTGRSGHLFAHATMPDPLAKRLVQAGIVQRNMGGMIPGYRRGGGVVRRGRSRYGDNDGRGFTVVDKRVSQQSGALTGSPTTAIPNATRPGVISRLQGSGWLPQRGVPGEMGMGRAMLYGTAGSIGGAAIGGSMFGQGGALVGSIAGGFLPQLMMSINAASAGGRGLASIFGTVFKVLKSLTIPGAIITALAIIGKKALDYKKHLEDVGKANRLAFGGTKDSFASVGINNFKTLGDRIKDINEQLKLHKAQVLSTYEAYTKAGPNGAGLTLTIKELRDAIENAKKNQKDYVEGFNNIDSNRVVQYASQLKAQFVAMGMSAQEAVNQIYAIISASDKASQALSAITSKDFVKITDQVSGIKFMISTLKKELDSEDFNAEEFNRGLDTLINSVIVYRQELLKVQEGGKNIYDDASSLKKVLEEISNIVGSTKQLNQDQLNNLKNENILYEAILSNVETIESVTAKILLYQEGFADTINLAAMTADQAVAFAKNLAVIQGEMNKITESTGKNNPLGPLAIIIARVKKESEDATAVVKKLKKVDEEYYENKIKNIEKTIKALEKERKLRLEALDVQEEAQSYEVQLSQARIRYTQAIATGDMALAAQEQLSIEQLVSDRQRQLTRDSINATYDAKIEKLQLQIERLRDELKAAQDSYNAKTANATQKSAELATLQKYRDDLEKIAIRNIGKETISESDKQEVSNIIQKMKEAGGEVAKAAIEMEKTYGVKTGTSKSPDEAKAAASQSFSSNLIKALNKGLEGNAGSNLVFKNAVEEFKNAVIKFKGGTPGSGAGTKSDPIIVNPGIFGDNPDKNYRDKNTGRLTTAAETYIGRNLDKFNLTDKPAYFDFDGRVYYWDGKYLGNKRMPVRKGGGRVVKGQSYLVGENRAEVFEPDSNGTIYPNAATYPGGMPNPMAMGMDWFGKMLVKGTRTLVKEFSGIDPFNIFGKKSGKDLLSMATMMMPMGGLGKAGAKSVSPLVAAMMANGAKWGAEGRAFQMAAIDKEAAENLFKMDLSKINLPDSLPSVNMTNAKGAIANRLSGNIKGGIESFHAGDWEVVQALRVMELLKKYPKADLSDVKTFNQLYGKEFYGLVGDPAIKLFKGVRSLDPAKSFTGGWRTGGGLPTYFSTNPYIAATYSLMLGKRTPEDLPMFAAQLPMSKLPGFFGEGAVRGSQAQGSMEFPMSLPNSLMSEIASGIKEYSLPGAIMGNWLKVVKDGSLQTKNLWPRFHDRNGVVPGPYGEEVGAILKAGTEGVYQEAYIKSLQNGTMNPGAKSPTVINMENTYNIPDHMTKEDIGRYIVDLQRKDMARLGVPRTR